MVPRKQPVNIPHCPASFGAGALWASSQLWPVLLKDPATQSSPGHTGVYQSQERLPGSWSLTCSGSRLCGYTDCEVLRVKNVYLKALIYFLVLLPIKTTVTKWLGLNLLLCCCSYHRWADLMPVWPAGGIRSRLLLCVQAACHSLWKSRSLHVCWVTVFKLLGREWKSVLKTIVVTGRWKVTLLSEMLQCVLFLYIHP